MLMDQKGAIDPQLALTCNSKSIDIIGMTLKKMKIPIVLMSRI